MRRRRSRLRLLIGLGIAALASAAHPTEAFAQRDLAEEGGLFLLLPTGARAVGLGQAVVASSPGSEAVWWNPAALAVQQKREAAIHHSEPFVDTSGDAISVVIPSALLGVLAASVNILNFGEQAAVDSSGTQTGTIIPRNIVYAASYATTLGSHLNAGLSYKVVQLRVDCSGSCADVPTFVGSTSSLDFGAQMDLRGALPVTMGIAVRNVGLRLQVKDEEQSDPLPTRVQVGAVYRVEALTRQVRELALDMSGDLLGDARFSSPAARFGADLSWEQRVFLRGGYRFDAGEAGGASVGVGLVAGSLVVDIARMFDALSEGTGESPTYLSLRYLF